METVFHDPRPHSAGSAELGDFFQQVVVRIEEERKAGCKTVDIKSCLDGSVNIGYPVGECKCDLLDRSASGLTHVIATDADHIPVGSFLGAIGKDVTDDAH